MLTSFKQNTYLYMTEKRHHQEVSRSNVAPAESRLIAWWS
jgi:hypothetical protein